LPAPNTEFARAASEEQLGRAAAALEVHGIHVVLAQNGVEAKRLVLEMVPSGSEVSTGASVSLETIGVLAEIEKSGRYNAVRPRTRAMDRATQAREIRKLGNTPDFMLGSAHALTEDGSLLIASLTGSQLGPYANGAGKVILVVGHQKIVPDLEQGFRRIYEYAYPLEDIHVQELYGMRSGVNKILIINREFVPGRITVVLVRETLGF
jgi:LUD domain